jgi:hypothetical protein
VELPQEEKEGKAVKVVKKVMPTKAQKTKMAQPYTIEDMLPIFRVNYLHQNRIQSSRRTKPSRPSTPPTGSYTTFSIWAIISMCN